MSTERWVIVSEANEWEGETWHTSFRLPADPDAQALLELIDELPTFSTRKTAEPPTEWNGGGYMRASVVLAEFDASRFLADLGHLGAESMWETLYKGGIRRYEGGIRRYGAVPAVRNAS